MNGILVFLQKPLYTLIRAEIVANVFIALSFKICEKVLKNRWLVVLYEWASSRSNAWWKSNHVTRQQNLESFHTTFDRWRAASTISFLFLLLLLAKGYTITRGRLSNVGARKMAILISHFIITYLIMFIWQIRVRRSFCLLQRKFLLFDCHRMPFYW